MAARYVHSCLLTLLQTQPALPIWTLSQHVLVADFFISALNTSMIRLMLVISLAYIVMWLFFGLIWWFVHL